jgi:hypothetical protein
VRPLPEELVDFVESGVSILVATRDAAMRPDATRGCGARVSEDRAQISVLLAERWSARALANVEETGLVAVGFSRLFDNRTIQIKGGGATVRPGAEVDQALAERYLAAYIDQLYGAGMPRSLTKRLHFWPARVVTFDAEALFQQTPGPGAGEPLASR